MAVNTYNLDETRLRVRKAIKDIECPVFRRGTYVWGKISKAHWPGIVLTHEDVQLSERRDHYIIFWFGDHRISHVACSGVEHFALNFGKFYKQKKVPLWQQALEESITHYGYPFTAGMHYNALIAFANSSQIQKIDFGSNLEDIPEFVKITIYARALFRKEQMNRAKKLKQIQYYLPHVIQNTCVACLSTIYDNHVPHPLWDANVCLLCARKLKEVLYQIKDGDYEYCFICGNTQNFKCRNLACEATFCNFCIKNYWAYSVVTSTAFCALCSTLMQGLIQLSNEYMLKSSTFMLSNENTTLLGKPNVSNELPRMDLTTENDIIVLTLFHGLSIGIEFVIPIPFNFILAIQCNNLHQNYEPIPDNSRINLYQVKRQLKKYLNNCVVRLASVTTHTPIERNVVHMHIEDLHRKKCRQIGRISLIVGGTNMLKNRFKHFRRKCFTDLFMEFWRVVNLFKEEVDKNIKWLYEMPFTLDMDEINFITRYVHCEPKMITANLKFCYVWTNLGS